MDHIDGNEADIVHRYRAQLSWEGSTAVGYDRYDRSHRATTDPPTVALDLSGDPAFGGAPALLNPEQLVVLAAASCQLLSFLAVAARARIDVLDYRDEALGEMPEGDPPVRLTRITLFPRITLAAPTGHAKERATERAAGPTAPRSAPSEERVRRLVELAHKECFVANSLRTEIVVVPTITFANDGGDPPLDS